MQRREIFLPQMGQSFRKRHVGCKLGRSGKDRKERPPVDLIDRIYEAAVIPELWAEACDLLSEETGAYSTALITLVPNAPPRWVSSACIAEQMKVYEESGLAARSPRPQRGLAIAPGNFMRDIDIMTPEELAVDPIRAELLEPIGLPWEMGAVFLEPSGSLLVFSQLSSAEMGPFGEKAVARMNALKADLARAAFLSARLAFKQARTMVQTLAMVGLPGAVVGDRGNVVAANAPMEDLAPRVRIGTRDRLHIADAGANALFSTALEQLSTGHAPSVQSLPIAATEDAPPLVLHLIPVRRNARDIFSRSSALLVFTPVGAVGPPDMRVLCGLFDLTRIEARVAQELTRGHSVEEVAAILGSRVQTVRTHLKAIFRKTGVNRQSQLVLLLSGLAPVGGTDPA
nr:helix-turn-helix transcriptional regulator [Shinella pollutisoli]